MILEFFALEELPFVPVLDAKFMYMSSTHRQAHTSLLLALQARREFVTLLAQPGMGKTILLSHTLQSLGDKVSKVYIHQASLTPVNLLGAILAKLGGHQADGNPEEMLSQLQDLLTQAHRVGKRVIVAIDEAQELDGSVFDLLWSLSTLAAERGRSLQFILSGQPLLTGKLAAAKPVQSTRDGAAVVHLHPFSADDTAQYVDHRLRAAGYSGQSPLFTPEAVGLIARFSQGVPRIVDNLCFEVMATAYRRRREQIEGGIVREVAATLDLARPTLQSVAMRPLPAAPAPLANATSAHQASLPTAAAAPVIVSAALSALKTVEVTSHLQNRQLLPESSSPPAIPQASAQASSIPRRTWAWRPSLVSPIVVAVLFIAAATVSGVYRAKMSPPSRKPIVQRNEFSGSVSTGATAAPGATIHATEAALDPSTLQHDLKGMDLKSALRALPWKRQSRRQRHGERSR